VRLREGEAFIYREAGDEFQFLLVRLRVPLQYTQIGLSPFQFLLVRLRDFVYDDMKAILHNFNSFWCD